jgi:hypothetical protein
MNRNLVGSIYGRSSIKIASSTPVSSTNKTDHHDIPVTEILLKEALNTILCYCKFIIYMVTRPVSRHFERGVHLILV